MIETLAWDGHGFRRLEAHLGRARASAAILGFAWNRAAIDEALSDISGDRALRVRLTIGRAGDVQLITAPLPPAPTEWRVAIASERLNPDDPALQHKTTARELYDRARANLPDGVDELIFLNTRDEVAEGTITNVFVDPGQGLITPPLSCGCLPGILRGELLASRAAREGVIRPHELRGARLFVGNSLRGLIPARLVE
ncbi:aminotransferase class IV family protein [Albidovulum inexpectatum]|uniref:aminotransferase class IV family protein n=1 Tax=Albidovulum inexpectatum TaxID=196587 RepID=UPI001FE48267|nr:aminotransferase class IV family protein [Albidovulum inexpectatum]